MANLKHTDIPYIKKFVETIYGAGYVLDLSNEDFQHFIKQVASVDIENPKYYRNGSSKGKRLKVFLELESNEIVGKTLKALLDHFEAYQTMNDVETDKNIDNLISTVDTISKRLLGKQSVKEKETKEEDFLEKEFEEIPIEKIGLDDGLSAILRHRVVEIHKGIKLRNPLSVIFLCGSSLEGILLGVALKNPELFNKAKSSPKDKEGKPFPFHQWSLASFIDVAYEVNFIGLDAKKFSHAMRDFRNYIHPYEQWRSGFNPDHYTAKISWQVFQAAVNDLENALTK